MLLMRVVLQKVKALLKRTEGAKDPEESNATWFGTAIARLRIGSITRHDHLHHSNKKC